MTEWQNRLIEEKADLDAKIGRLDQFRRSDEFRMLDQIDRDLLEYQAAMMRGYSTALGERIKRFTG